MHPLNEQLESCAYCNSQAEIKYANLEDMEGFFTVECANISSGKCDNRMLVEVDTPVENLVERWNREQIETRNQES